MQVENAAIPLASVAQGATFRFPGTEVIHLKTNESPGNDVRICRLADGVEQFVNGTTPVIVDPYKAVPV